MPTTSLRTLAPAVTLALAFAAAAAAQTADALFRGFEPTGDWALVVEGQEAAKAKIYDSTRAQALLIVSAEFASPVLIDRAGRTVATLDLMKVAERADGTVDLLADALLEPAGALEVARKLAYQLAYTGVTVISGGAGCRSTAPRRPMRSRGAAPARAAGA